jgi:hypothetical protein
MRGLVLFAALFNLFAATLNAVVYIHYGHWWFNLLCALINSIMTVWMFYDYFTWRPVE